jgi:hypothetical protein
MSQETALHAWHHIDLVNQIIGLLLRVIDDIRHRECELEVKDRKEKLCAIDDYLAGGGQLNICRVIPEQCRAHEEFLNLITVQADAHDELVSLRREEKDTPLETVRFATEKRFLKVIVLILGCKVSIYENINAVDIVIAKTIESFVPLYTKHVDESVQVEHEFVQVMEANGSDFLHIRRVGHFVREVGTQTIAEFGIGEAEGCSGEDYTKDSG